MKTIFKYPLQVADRQTIEMPTGAKALSVQVQHGQPVLWAMVDKHPADYRSYIVYMAGTGHDLLCLADPKAEFLGTIQLEGGALVFHVFTSF